MTPFHPTVEPVLSDLRRRFPDSAFLALGQTVWWDEPMKAVLRRMLDRTGLGGSMCLGVHDTDYFAKVSLKRKGAKRFDLLPHNDGTTRDLWSAAGEIARLFGSETVVRRADFIRHGTAFGRAQKGAGDSFYDDVSEAWGWRGLVYTGSRDLIVNSLSLAEMRQAIDAMLAYGFQGTSAMLLDACCRREAEQAAQRMMAWVEGFSSRNPNATLSQLYQDVLPRLHSELLGSAPQDCSVTCTTDLLRLTPETARLPRFKFAHLFLDPATSELARTAYDQAVAGSEIYPLERFGLGATPFDVIVPEVGRGTLRVTLRAIHIEAKKPVRIRLARPVESIQDLAQVLHAEYGDQVTLVGKAVALISMLAQEFIFVFNEEGSGYVNRTRQMNDLLRAEGINLDMRPILRLKYPTWDALEAAPVTLRLPDHMAKSFGRASLSAPDFAATWKTAVEASAAELNTLSSMKSPDQLLSSFGSDSSEWHDLASSHTSAKEELLTKVEQALALNRQVRTEYELLENIKSDLNAAFRAKGDHFRAISEWTPEAEAHRETLQSRIDFLLDQRRAILERIQGLKAQRWAVERNESAMALRSEIVDIEQRAERERMRRIAALLSTAEGLKHTDHRPSAWWLPMVDRTGSWFERIASRTEIYTQAM